MSPDELATRTVPVTSVNDASPLSRSTLVGPLSSSSVTPPLEALTVMMPLVPVIFTSPLSSLTATCALRGTLIVYEMSQFMHMLGYCDSIATPPLYAPICGTSCSSCDRLSACLVTVMSIVLTLLSEPWIVTSPLASLICSVPCGAKRYDPWDFSVTPSCGHDANAKFGADGTCESAIANTTRTMTTMTTRDIRALLRGRWATAVRPTAGSRMAGIGCPASCSVVPFRGPLVSGPGARRAAAA